MHWDYTTDKLLTQEYVRNFVKYGTKLGLELSALSRAEGTPYRGHLIPMIVAVLNGIQLFTWHFYHADFHRGNWYMWPDPEDGRVKMFICDFGMLGQIPEDEIPAFADLTGGAMVGDADAVKNALLLWHKFGGGKPHEVNMDAVDSLAQFMTQGGMAEIDPHTGFNIMRSQGSECRLIRAQP